MSLHVCRCVRQSVFINVFIHLAIVFWFIMWRLVTHSQTFEYQGVVGSKILHTYIPHIFFDIIICHWHVNVFFHANFNTPQVLPDFYVKLSSLVAGVKCLIESLHDSCRLFGLNQLFSHTFSCFLKTVLLGLNLLPQLCRLLAGLGFPFKVNMK